jgi:hypothetical protein
LGGREVEVVGRGSVVEVVELVDAVVAVGTLEVVRRPERAVVVEVVDNVGPAAAVELVELVSDRAAAVVDVVGAPDVLDMTSVTGAVVVSGAVDGVDDVVVAKLFETVGVREVVGVPGVVEVVEDGGAVVDVVDVAGAREVPGTDVVEDAGRVTGGVVAGTVDADVLGVVDGNAPGGDCGRVVLVVLELLTPTEVPGLPSPPELSGTVVDGRVLLVVDDVAVLGAPGTVVVVVVLLPGPVVVVVAAEVLVEDDVVAGALVVVVTGTKLVVVVVEPVVVVVADSGSVGSVVSADASRAGASPMVMPNAKKKRAARDAAVSRASRLLELWEDKGIQAPRLWWVGSVCWPPTG